MSAGHGATGRRDRNGRCKPDFHAPDRDVNPKPSLTGESTGREPEGAGETNRHQKRRNREKTASSQEQGRRTGAAPFLLYHRHPVFTFTVYRLPAHGQYADADF
ncbi:TPA: hypothetical protein G8S40_004194 [Salmonella enterica]|uniref:Uncharacterized protein n=1 Tax=Salmonella enterica TaxID=28901 RepID=A0A757VVG1_SALER|nr:hypothetical protein [Salmonella enterica]